MVALYVDDAPAPTPTPLGQALRRLREELGMSQAELARVAGVDRSYVSMLENGRRRNASYAFMKAIAGALVSRPGAGRAAPGGGGGADDVSQLATHDGDAAPAMWH